MIKRGLFHQLFITALAGTFILLAMWTIPAHAQIQSTQAEPKCVNCHEDLYLLHDTGKWFCLNEETPMTCVGCHGGNPEATTQKAAHTDRSPYPVINENISKCQECHPEQCTERVAEFGKVAGFSPVMVAAAYAPVMVVAGPSNVPVAEHEQPSAIILWQEGLILAIIVVFVLTVVLITRYRRGGKFPR
jgi:hypothetical protein